MLINVCVVVFNKKFNKRIVIVKLSVCDDRIITLGDKDVTTNVMEPASYHQLIYIC